MADSAIDDQRSRAAQHRITVLLVEDDPGHVELIERAFDDATERVELRVARTLSDARRRLARETPTLVISDLMLPDGRGQDLFSNGPTRSYPIIAMTSHGDEQVAVDAMKAGASDYVVKSAATLAAMPRIARRVLNDWENIQARRRLEAQLQQAQKLEGLGHLAGNVAHDFNNLLTVILGNAESVRGALGQASPLAEEMNEIVAAGRRAATLASQLLAFARRQPMSARVVQPGRVLADIESLLRRLVGTSVELVTMAPPGGHHVVIDPHQFEQVLLNLAVNARDAMPEGGLMTIEVTDTTLGDSGSQRFPDAPPGDYVQVTVRDTGVGIPPAVLPHIFEPFFTTKASGRGTGLGLSICYGMVTQSGGHIAAESELGRGAAFHVIFPRALPQQVEADALLEERLPVLPPGEETVLLVDDEAMVRTLTAKMLRVQGYTVIDVAQGADALERAEALTRLDLLVTDVVMPQMSGRQLADRLGSEFPGLRVLFISGFGPPEPGLELNYSGGRWGFLPKPFSLTQLATRVRELLDAPQD